MELLRPLILLQHEAFTQSIIDLGTTNLFLSEIIEKKTESLKQIKYNNKIPRSLRIKCGLTTSPSYTGKTDFIRLKDDLQEVVSTFIKKGTEIMTDWAEINIQLLKKDRCTTTISKALLLLDGLSSFFLEVIGTPHFPSLPNIKCINLFLWKLYLSNQYIEVDTLAIFFDLPLEQILTLGAKIITKADLDEEVNSILQSINLSDIDMNNVIHEGFLSETLISFDQILKMTTIHVWDFQKEKNKHTMAAQNLRAKMSSLQMINATEATAHAIAKATENINITNTKDLTSNLRLSNLEKQVRKQDQKLNEQSKMLHQQKNLHRSHSTGSVASPDHLQTRKFQNNQKNKQKKKIQQVIDLLNEETEEVRNHLNPQAKTLPMQNQHTLKRQQKQGDYTQHSSKKGKTVHWKNEKANTTEQQYPNTNTTFSVNPQHLHTTLLQNSFHGSPPIFQPEPSPFSLQTQNPFHNFTPNNNNTFGQPQTFQQSQVFHQLPPHWNTNQNFLQPPTNKSFQRNSTKENPFGIRHG